MGTDGITSMDSILNINEMEGDRQHSDAASMLRRRRAEEEKKKKELVDKVDFNGYYYYYYSDFTKSPTIGPSMSPSMSPTDKKVLPIQEALVVEPKVSRAQFNHYFGTPYSATAVICAGCLFIVLSLGFFAYARNPSRGDEVVSKTIDRISKLKPNRGGKSDGKGKKRGQGGAAATAEAEETGSETYLCEDEENRTLSDHNSTCAADSEIGREEVAEFNTENSANMPLSPLFLGHDDNNPTSTRSGPSPPSHLGLLTSEQFDDETILNLKTVVNLFGQKWSHYKGQCLPKMLTSRILKLWILKFVKLRKILQKRKLQMTPLQMSTIIVTSPLFHSEDEDHDETILTSVIAWS